MGEYEPNDSRDVTLKPGTEAGGLERTGPREAEARRDAERKKAEEAKSDGLPPRGHQLEQRAAQGKTVQQAQQQGVQLPRDNSDKPSDDADTPEERGYGGASEQRKEKLDDGKGE